MSCKRVLHIVGRMDRAGAETMIMNLYREIDRTKFQFDFVYFTEDRCDYDDEIKTLGGRIIRVNSSNTIGRFVSLIKILRKGTWQIVHAHTLFSAGLHLLAAKITKVPMLVAHSHNTSDANSSSIIGQAYQKSMRWLLHCVPTKYIACGKAAGKYLFPERDNVQIIPNAIDINLFSNAQKDAVQAELNLTSETLVILQVGRFSPVKNYHYSIKIASALKEQKIDFKMLFVGVGQGENDINNAIVRDNLEDYVSVLGLRADIPELMAAADVMLMPSLHEGFPVVLVESQAAGLPAVIATTISPEVDLQIGLVDLIDLDEAPYKWVERIVAISKVPVLPVSSRCNVLESRGFSSKAGAERLMGVYNNI